MIMRRKDYVEDDDDPPTPQNDDVDYTFIIMMQFQSRKEKRQRKFIAKASEEHKGKIETKYFHCEFLSDQVFSLSVSFGKRNVSKTLSYPLFFLGGKLGEFFLLKYQKMSHGLIILFLSREQIDFKIKRGENIRQKCFLAQNIFSLGSKLG